MAFAELWAELLPVGRDERTGGYRRYSWTEADAAAGPGSPGPRPSSGCGRTVDRNGNLWAWWGRPSGLRQADRQPAVTWTRFRTAARTTGRSASCPRSPRSVSCASEGFRPARPIGVAAFTEEEGARFGVACLGSRLATGAIDPAAAAQLRDRDGSRWSRRCVAAGRDAARSALTTSCWPASAPTSSCTSSRAAPWRACALRRRRRGDMAARPLAVRLRRPGGSRGHDPPGRPA